jgi:hypothetical protein
MARWRGVRLFRKKKQRTERDGKRGQGEREARGIPLIRILAASQLRKVVERERRRATVRPGSLRPERKTMTGRFWTLAPGCFISFYSCPFLLFYFISYLYNSQLKFIWASNLVQKITKRVGMDSLCNREPSHVNILWFGKYFNSFWIESKLMPIMVLLKFHLFGVLNHFRKWSKVDGWFPPLIWKLSMCLFWSFNIISNPFGKEASVCLLRFLFGFWNSHFIKCQKCRRFILRTSWTNMEAQDNLVLKVSFEMFQRENGSISIFWFLFFLHFKKFLFGAHLVKCKC